MIDFKSMRADSGPRLNMLVGGFDPSASREALLETCDEIALHFLIVAVAALLADANPQKFFVNLCRLGENARRWLGLFARRGLPLPPASSNTPLLGVLAAGQFDAGATIASASRDSRAHEDGEYEDEFLWAAVLQRLAVAPAPSDEVEELLVRLEQTGADSYGDRVSVVRALIAGDAEAFAKAFGAARQGYELTTEKLAARFGTPFTKLAPHRYVWFEGLALLRLGERAGLEVKGELKYCPALARVPMTARYEGDWAIEIGLQE